MAVKPTKRGRSKASLTGNTPDTSSPPPFPLRPDASSEPERRTLTLKLDESGAPLWAKHTPVVLGAWREVLEHPATREAFGVTPGAPLAAVPDALNDEAVDGLYALVGQFQALAFSSMFKLPFSECAQLCAFSKDERAALVTPTQKLIAKYGTALTSKYADEINLLMLLGVSTVQRFMLCKATAKMKAGQVPIHDDGTAADSISEAAPFMASG